MNATQRVQKFPTISGRRGRISSRSKSYSPVAFPPCGRERHAMSELNLPAFHSPYSRRIRKDIGETPRQISSSSARFVSAKLLQKGTARRDGRKSIIAWRGTVTPPAKRIVPRIAASAIERDPIFRKCNFSGVKPSLSRARARRDYSSS